MKTRTALMLFFHFQYNTDILTLNISQYRYQSGIGMLGMIVTFITYLQCGVFEKDASSDVTQTELKNKQSATVVSPSAVLECEPHSPVRVPVRSQNGLLYIGPLTRTRTRTVTQNLDRPRLGLMLV